MKVTLDLTRLLHERKITREEFDRLGRLAARDTGSLALNILIGCGVVAVGGAGLALVPTAATAMLLGGLLMAAGIALLVRFPVWLVLANICILVAALMFGGGALVLTGGSVSGFLLVAAIFAVSAVAARSALLTALSVLGVTGAAGAGTFYGHALYEIDVARPALTILVCGGLALAAHHLSKAAGPAMERLCIAAARTALLCANVGFWVGSLWGDRMAGSSAGAAAPIPAAVFAVGWAAALLLVGLWAVRANRRWTLNLTAVFGAIHFYTQWFEHLSATPLSVLAAGLVTLAIAAALWRWNGGARPADDRAGHA